VIQYQINLCVDELEENTDIRILCFALSSAFDVLDLHTVSKSCIKEEKSPSELGTLGKANIDQWRQWNGIRHTSDYGNL
jgi:hypothetical protein